MADDPSHGPVCIVWFKRDLRTVDHAALHAASARGRVLCLYIAEPDVVTAPDFAPRHWTFLRHSLLELRDRLTALGGGLMVRSGDAVSVLESLRRAYGPRIELFSHEETGNAVTFARDRAVRRWCRECGVPWHEFRQFGVIRGLKDRTGWARRWEAFMFAPTLPEPAALRWASVSPDQWGDLPTHADLGLAADATRHTHTPGRATGLRLLETFLAARGQHYHEHLSSPLTAWDGCSRLSPYIAYGNVSLREVVQATRRRRADIAAGRHRPGTDDVANAADPSAAAWRKALYMFDARLHWHCHFMQKLESEPRIEFENFVPALTGLREPHFSRERFDAWAAGQTGYPMVDAVMRCLHATGWINFRMRCLVMSFAAYDLFLHWREPALHLARLFTDYEPGIHYPQAQMQSGTTGINTLRMYSPVKQGYDHDPEGDFVRRWVPELADVPQPYIHEPWTAPSPPTGYPRPVVNHETAVAAARAAFAAWRRRPDVRAQADAVLERHGSRRAGLPQVRRPAGRGRPANSRIAPSRKTAPPTETASLFDSDDA
ncbi:MAG: FAD-binding domain-containing protein [Tepidisphaerales bacterium]